MIAHVLRIVWNRKRASAMLALEIAVSFLVLFAVVGLAVFALDNYTRPLGFSYENVWNVSVDRQVTTDDMWTPGMVESTKQLFVTARELPEVEAIAAAQTVPYSNSASISSYDFKGAAVTFGRDEVTDGFKDVMGLTLVRGRWFSKEDDGSAESPVVITVNLAHTMFGSDDPVGQVIAKEEQGRPAERVIGVVTDFRKNGEYSGAGNFAFFRANLDDPKVRPPANILIRLRPGTTRGFEERLLGALQATAREWSFTIQPLAEMRALFLRVLLAPFLAAGLVAGFLILMVGLGLTGVLWQNVTQRTREIGVRRAKGATAENIVAQILGEITVVATAGIALGAVVAVQVPLLGLMVAVSGKVYVLSFVISLVALYAVTLLCGLYPSLLAARIQPAEALRCE